jgi:hypothetical protein
VTVDAWLASHHVRESESAKACFHHNDAGQTESPCGCDKSLVLPGLDVDALLCEEGPEWRVDSMGPIHIVMYAVVHEHLRKVFDAPFGVMTPSEEVPEAMALSVALDVSVDGDALVFSDKGDCPRVLASVDAQVAEEMNANGRSYSGDIRKRYAAVCATVGRWRWLAGHFVHVSSSAGGSGLPQPVPVATSGR